MKTIDDLNREQLGELRVNMLHELFAALDMGTPSYGDIVFTRDFITDTLLWAYYDGVLFSDDDFSCTAA